VPAIGRFGRQLTSFFWRDSVADQVDAELDFHLEMLTLELMEQGLTRDAARAQALQRFGDMQAVNVECRTIGLKAERETRRTEYLAELRQDAAHAVRQLRRAPGFTAVALLTLILAIGANTAIFSVVRAVLLRPLPYPSADRLAVLWGSVGDQPRYLLSFPDLEEWRARNHTFGRRSHSHAERQSHWRRRARPPDRLFHHRKHAEAARRPRRDRTSLQRRRDRPNQWSASGRALVRRVEIPLRVRSAHRRPDADPERPPACRDRRDCTRVPGSLRSSRGLAPITSAPNANWLTRDNPSLWGVGLVKPGVTWEQAGRDLSSIAGQLARDFPASNAGVGASIVPLQDFVVGQVRPALLIVLGFVALVLLIACANIANLQLARSASRRREMSLRAALGAGHGRLARQLLTESLVLSLIGGGAGILLAHWSIDALVAAVPGGLPVFGEVGLDSGVLLFSTAITLLAGLFFGAAPALYATRADINDSLQTRGGDGVMGGKGDIRNAFVALQLALCIVLLVGAGLLTRSLDRLQREKLGFEPGNLLTAEYRLPAAKYQTDEQIAQFTSAALERIRAVPGIRSAALLGSVPLSGNWGSTNYLPDGQAPPANGVLPTTQINAVTDGFFRTMGIPLLEGRDFDLTDRAGSPPVTIVNQELARRAWPNQSAIGRRIKIVGPPDVLATVVGVAGDVKQLTLSEPAQAQLYQPKLQSGGIFGSVAARTDGDPMALANQMRAAIWSVDRDQPVWKIRSMQSLVERDVAPQRFTTILTVSFALLALVLAAVGVYGVMSYAVAQRTREIGIRMALGAGQGQVVRMVVIRGLWIIGVATGVGLATSYVATRFIRSQLFGVSATDLVTFVAMPVALAAIATMACYLPARRAARVDPVVALQAE
jgi:putative ABC transport system permease protein